MPFAYARIVETSLPFAYPIHADSRGITVTWETSLVGSGRVRRAGDGDARRRVVGGVVGGVVGAVVERVGVLRRREEREEADVRPGVDDDLAAARPRVDAPVPLGAAASVGTRMRGSKASRGS